MDQHNVDKPANHTKIATKKRKHGAGEGSKSVLERLKADFDTFVTALWYYQGLPPPSDTQLNYCRRLQQGPDRQLNEAHRGFGKSWIAIAYALWELLRNRNAKVLLTSQSQQKAMDSLFLARSWIEATPFLRHLRASKKQRWGAEAFDVGGCRPHKDPSMVAIGITGQLTGSRADLIIADDIETMENSRTKESRITLRRRRTEFDSVLLPGGKIVVLGTPQHEESIYNELPAMGYQLFKIPARYPHLSNEGQSLGLSPLLRGLIQRGEKQPGDPTWPERFNDDDLTKREIAKGKSEFLMQFQLDTQMADLEGYPLKLEDLIVFPVNRDSAPLHIAWGKTNILDLPCIGMGEDSFYSPIMFDKESANWKNYSATKAYIDPSGKGDDRTAWAIIAQLNGYLYVKEVGSTPEQVGFSQDLLHQIARSFKHHKVIECVVEENFGGGMFAQLLRPVIAQYFVRDDPKEDFWACQLLDERTPGRSSKENRICDTLEPVMGQHRLVFDFEVAKNQRLCYQITRISRMRDCLQHDDEVDALAGCVAMWKDVLHSDPDQAAAREMEHRKEERLRAYAKMGTPRRGSWTMSGRQRRTMPQSRRPIFGKY